MARRTKKKQGTVRDIADILGLSVTGSKADINLSIDNSLDRITKSLQLTSGGQFSPTKLNSFIGLTNQASSDKKDAVTHESRKRMVDITRLMMGATDTEMFETLNLEEYDRYQRYQDAAGVVELIPEMVTAYEIYKSSIVSPDSFTNRDPFLPEYLGQDTGNQINARMNSLISRYETDRHMQYAINESLKKGDSFLMILKLEKELRKVFAQLPDLKTEDMDFDFDYSESYTDDGVPTADNLRTMLLNQDSLNEDASMNTNILTETLDSFAQSNNFNIDSALLESGAYGMEYNGQEFEAVYNEQQEFQNDFESIVSKQVRVLNPDDYAKIYAAENMSDRDLEKIAKNTISDRNNAKQASNETQKKDNDETVLGPKESMYGSIVKSVPPEQVIKLWSNNMCHGYLVYEEDEGYLGRPGQDTPTVYSMGAPDIQSTGRLRQIMNRSSGRGRTSDNVSGRPNNAKTNFLVDLFGSVLSKRVSKSRLMSSPEYARFTQHMLDRFILRNKRVRVTYFEPDEIIHFAPNMDQEDGYGRSFTHSTIFYSKLLLALITNTLMWNIKLNREHNIWYIEVGQDEADEEAVHEFVASLKAKEITMQNLTSVSQTLADAGDHQDLLIPVTDGEKPVERESMQAGAGDRSIGNDEMREYLIKAILTSVVVPPAIAGIEDVEYARTLAMQNGRFLRKVLQYQGMYQEPCSKVYRMLYANEFMPSSWKAQYSDAIGDINSYLARSDVKSFLSGIRGAKPEEYTQDSNKTDRKDTSIDQIIFDLLHCRFNQPFQLILQNLSEGIRNFTEYAESLTPLFYGQSPEDENEVATFKLELAKNLLPQIPWEEYDEIMLRAKIDKTHKNLKKGDEEGGGGMGGF